MSISHMSGAIELERLICLKILYCTEMDLLISVHYDIPNISIFKAPYLHPGEDRHMCPLTYLYGIQYSTTFI